MRNKVSGMLVFAVGIFTRIYLFMFHGKKSAVFKTADLI